MPTMLSLTTGKIFLVALLSTSCISDASAAMIRLRQVVGREELDLRDMTNGQRLARGLPLKKPDLYRRGA